MLRKEIISMPIYGQGNGFPVPMPRHTTRVGLPLPHNTYGLEKVFTVGGNRGDESRRCLHVCILREQSNNDEEYRL